MRWPEFSLLVVGLLSCRKSRMRAMFAPPPESAERPDTDEE